ncbi:MAG: zinc ribbon domain-containing protein, partial [Caldilineaceae bacterium]|nr:zinc ribbon domain-containing protein [Caldilineaceae bacterium]
SSALLDDKEKIARAQSGPDIHCGYCGARNPASAEICHQCGANLAEGEARAAGRVVGAYGASAPAEVQCQACGMSNPAAAHHCVRCGAPLGRPEAAAKPAAIPAPSRRGGGGMNTVFVVVALLVVALAGWFVVSLFRTSDMTATAVQARWELSVNVMGPVAVNESAWRDEIPDDARDIACQPRVRRTSNSPQPGAEEVCGTPYTVDTGTGVGKVVQDCQYRVYGDFCRYTATGWGVVDTVAQRGVGLSPQWPSPALAAGQEIGERRERYVCVVSDGQKEYSFELRSRQTYEQCQEGSRWKLEVNALGSVVSAERVQ